ncbi:MULTISPECIES: allophanate hydrolase subunit 1 [unclassified Crossiella]|uniref:5-oxoprolinase subunit B family protein n=1 Tax=unclassified Crossiella TaxID=2620835 RepID=UPI001FFF272B|nr:MULTISPECIES: allophanate hydrolase subunit 1 [unclassified Crossiella]MCK2243038.1 allophanate hydrolase subunit 1 [Crossiella sp. S99.2]MCK2256915.1 allophanate hydrolase subunit 1 [Crossiella sp. S99.1]
MHADIRRFGSSAALVELPDSAAAHALHALLTAQPPAGVLELVPAARTVLVRYDPRATNFTTLREHLDQHAPPPGMRAPATTVEVPVRYDGPDLGEVAELTGLAAAEVVRRHLGGEYTVSFCGFAPGFAYVTGLDPALRVPRRETSRTRVPAGAVAIADEFVGIYPRSSPGGWRLLGQTDLVLWDTARARPGLLTAGTRVRFREVAA